MKTSVAENLDRDFDHVLEKARRFRLLSVMPQQLLFALAETLHCQWAAYWQVDSARTRLHPVTVWTESGLETETLLSHTSKRALAANEGTVGHVWKTGRPVLTTNVLRDMCLPRSIDASSCGFRRGIWFAVKTEIAVHGVVELLGRHIDPAGAEAVTTVENLGIALGRLIEAEEPHDERFNLWSR
jgi:hypothetical protein